MHKLNVTNEKSIMNNTTYNKYTYTIYIVTFMYPQYVLLYSEYYLIMCVLK